MEPVTDINGFLNEAKTAITEYQDLCSRTKDIKASKEKCEKTLITEKEALQKSIEDAIAKRREEIDDTYDQEIKNTTRNCAAPICDGTRPEIRA